MGVDLNSELQRNIAIQTGAAQLKQGNYQKKLKPVDAATSSVARAILNEQSTQASSKSLLSRVSNFISNLAQYVSLTLKIWSANSNEAAKRNEIKCGDNDPKQYAAWEKYQADQHRYTEARSKIKFS